MPNCFRHLASSLDLHTSVSTSPEGAASVVAGGAMVANLLWEFRLTHCHASLPFHPLLFTLKVLVAEQQTNK